ncbi:MAG: regulatory protein RecX [Candidatus Bipolaricaulia bacterium]
MPRDEAKQYLLRLLRYRPRSRAEAESRLRKRGYSDELIREILTWAEDMGMIDDEAFAKLWIADRLERRPRGRALLRRELREKGVSPGLIERALDRAGMDEEALARSLAAERLERYRKLSPEERRRRTLALLARRGFPFELSRRVLRELLGNLDKKG